MEKVWEVFENLNEYVYAADMNTYELVYMNKKLRKKLGYTALEETAGKKCYEVMHGYSVPCLLCSNKELSVGNYKEWWNYDPESDKHYVLKDTLVKDGERLIRIGLAFDIGAPDWRHNSYHYMESIVNDGLRAALMEPTPDRTLMVLLEYLGKVLNGERTYIFEKNQQGGDDNTYEWAAEGVTPQKDNLQNLPPEVCANWYNNFEENKSIVIKDLEEIRESDPIQYENLKSQNIDSLTVVPLYENGSVIGFFGVDNPPEERIEYAETLLQIMGHFIVSSLKRRNLVRKLQVMSFSDQLTNLGNRYAMQHYIKEKLKECETIGVVYCDITGLKRTNDNEGHESGDRYILRACDSLSKAFEGYGLFRIGGDELLALCPQIEESDFMGRLELLKKYLKDNSVVMAIGAIRKEFCSNTDEIINEAESLMYEDKAAYYRFSGVDRRK